MAIVIELVTVGDEWFNRDEIEQKLRSIPIDDVIVFSTRKEGISLKSCGFLDFLNAWVEDHGIDSSSVQIDTPNQFENIPYKFYQFIPRSHFLYRDNLHFDSDVRDICPESKLFGIFVGRFTHLRNQIVKEMLEYKNHCLFSVMINDQADLSNPCTVTYDPEIREIGSIDGMCISDQWDLTKRTRQSLLNFYDQFQIEIVCETMTQGETFFPTEKTVRPIMGCRPMLVVSSKHFLSNLKKLGFRTWNDLWNEEYDQLEGASRWAAIKNNVINIINEGYDVDKAQEIALFNYRVLQELLDNS